MLHRWGAQEGTCTERNLVSPLANNANRADNANSTDVHRCVPTGTAPPAVCTTRVSPAQSTTSIPALLLPPGAVLGADPGRAGPTALFG